MVVYTDMCSTLPFQCQMIFRNAVWHDMPRNIRWDITLCCTLNTWFLFSYLSLAEHTLHQILLHCISQCLLCLVSSLFSWLVVAACLLSLAVWSWFTLPASCKRPLTNVNLNCQWDNVEPQEARVIKQLTMVTSRRGRAPLSISKFVCYRVRVCHVVRFVHISQVSVSLVLWPISQPFYAHHTNYPPLLENACSSVCLNFVCHSILWLSH